MRGKRRSFNFDPPVEKDGIEGAEEQGKFPGTEGERENCDLGAKNGVVRVLHDPVRTAPDQTEIGCRNDTCLPLRTERYNHPKASELQQDEERIMFASEFNASARDQ